MKLFDWVAAVVLFLQLPIPLFWLIVHRKIEFWRKHVRAGYWVAGLSAWGIVAIFLYAFHEHLFLSERAPAWAIAVGLGLMAADAYVLYRVKRDLGRSRLVGQTEMEGGGDLATQGLYARVRHPRYIGMMVAVLGACLVAGSRCCGGRGSVVVARAGSHSPGRARTPRAIWRGLLGLQQAGAALFAVSLPISQGIGPGFSTATSFAIHLWQRLGILPEWVSRSPHRVCSRNRADGRRQPCGAH